MPMVGLKSKTSKPANFQLVFPHRIWLESLQTSTESGKKKFSVSDRDGPKWVKMIQIVSRNEPIRVKSSQVKSN